MHPILCPRRGPSGHPPPGASQNGVLGLVKGRLKGYLKGSGGAPSMTLDPVLRGLIANLRIWKMASQTEQGRGLLVQLSKHRPVGRLGTLRNDIEKMGGHLDHLALTLCEKRAPLACDWQIVRQKR